jgi:hypothetical protein
VTPTEIFATIWFGLGFLAAPLIVAWLYAAADRETERDTPTAAGQPEPGSLLSGTDRNGGAS